MVNNQIKTTPSGRKYIIKENYHVPYYSPGRYYRVYLS